MAQRRMFSLQIVDTDAFMDMPLSAQALYFHLGMRADDDGFIGNARRVQRLLGASDDDFKLLVMKGFLLAFPSGVIVIRHWRALNYIQKDRYKPTIYQEEKAALYLGENGVYTVRPEDGAAPCKQEEKTAEIPAGSDVYEPVYIPDTQVRLGKDRLGKVNMLSGDGGRSAREAEEKAVENEDVLEGYMQQRELDTGQYLGVKPEDVEEAGAFAVEAFSRFCNRPPTAVDKTRVFLALRHTSRREGAWEVTFPQSRKELLLYAFEAANKAGKPGDWNYIDGVLKKLALRGIRSLSEAEEYDFARHES